MMYFAVGNVLNMFMEHDVHFIIIVFLHERKIDHFDP